MKLRLSLLVVFLGAAFYIASFGGLSPFRAQTNAGGGTRVLRAAASGCPARA